jgi:hypothetical protein
MDVYDVELETSESDRICLTVPALPGLLILGRSIHEVLQHAELSIAFHTRDARVTTHSPRVQLRPIMRSR